ncbi:MAG: hypothetical protein AB7F20_07630 [Geoalkalibacter sp.]|uniref:hypothetical protein n=1 Tax=Geoalkalibacter sp. TaxID=3041440 RepID=UPI003D13C02D
MAVKLEGKYYELIFADPESLLHLAREGFLHVLSRFDKIIIIDIAEIELTRNLSKPFSAETSQWIKQASEDGKVEIAETPTGESYRLAITADPDYRPRDAGVVAIASWLYEHFEEAGINALVIHENRKLPNLLKNLLGDCEGRFSGALVLGKVETLCLCRSCRALKEKALQAEGEPGGCNG